MLIQIVNFKTWSRVINGVKKESLLYHIYTNDITLLNNFHFETPIFGDHVIAIVTIPLKNSIRPSTNCVTRRDWRSYSVSTVIEAYAAVDFTILGMISSENGNNNNGIIWKIVL